MAVAAATTSPFSQSSPLLHRPSSSRPPSSTLHLPNPNPNLPPPSPTILAGPRDNRPPLRRGRTLTSEAIIAIQSLKRPRGDSSAVDRIVSTTLARLIKSDLLAALTELQRQDQWQLSLKVFAAVRREYWYITDCALYANMIVVLARTNRSSEIDLLLVDLMEELNLGGGVMAGDLRGPARLVKALVFAGKGKAVKDFYGMMKRGGCELNNYLFNFMIKGLRRLGEEDAACEVEKDYELWGYGGVSAELQTV